MPTSLSFIQNSSQKEYRSSLSLGMDHEGQRYYLDRTRQIEEERDRTLREWSSRIDRLNSIDSGLVEPQVSSRYAIGGRDGYAGFYHYLTSKDSGRRGTHGTSSSQRYSIPNRPTNFERWISDKNPHPSQPTNRKSQGEPQPIQINQSEIKEIHRCFQAADTDDDGWLDCEGFKVFMSMRGAPITHLDARKLIKVIDHKYQRYISFEQVMYLVLHCGITTDQEVPISPDEFNRILQRMRVQSIEKEKQKEEVWPQNHHHHQEHRRRPQTVQESPNYYSRDLRPHPSRVLQNSFPMDNSRCFFEDMASEVQLKAQDEHLYKEYRREIRRNGHRRRPETSPPEQIEYEGPPGWKNMILHSQDPSYHIPPIVFDDVRRDWETRIRDTEEGVNLGGQEGRLLELQESPRSIHPRQIHGAPKGLPASHFAIPGRPQPFVMTQTELQTQLDKIRKKGDVQEGLTSDDVKTDVIFKGKVVSSSNSSEEIPRP